MCELPRAGRTMRLSTLLSTGLLLSSYGWAQSSSPADPWQSGGLPFSFRYGGRDSTQFLAGWRRTERTDPGSDGRMRHAIFTDPATRLTITANVRTFSGYDAVDWDLSFANGGTGDTPILECIEPLDLKVQYAGAAILHHVHGSKAQLEDFEPLTDVLQPGGALEIESKGGRSSQNSMPFFNLQFGGGGIAGAVGWTGNWSATFASDPSGSSLRLLAGMKRTHLLLHPGEEIRTPRILLMNWKGTDWGAAQNEWRRLMLDHFSVREGGRPQRGPVSFGTWGADSAAHKLAQIRLVRDERLPFDVYWIDASWYDKCAGHEMTGFMKDGDSEPFWRGRGSWTPNPKNYPEGLRPVSDAAHAAGMKLLLWMEPEEADPGTTLRRAHPDWFFYPPNANNPGSAVLRLGDSAVRKGIADLISKIITDAGVDWYRQDFNLDPERTWIAADAPDRIGMTEIRYIEGLYALWDDLQARHPGLRIDNCAIGGQRLDIETLSRSYPLWRSDLAGPPNGDITSQLQTQGLAPWVPLNGAVPWTNPGPFSEDEAPPDPFDARLIYTFRSAYSAAMVVGPGQAAGKDHAWCAKLRQQLEEYREVQPYIYGDFYPLLDYSAAEDAFVAWQWDRPDKGGGAVIALHRAGCAVGDVSLSLRALDPAASYDVELRPGLEKAAAQIMSGSALARLHLRIDDRPGSVLVFYRRR
jgi:alpha-galactosidase